MPGGPHAAPTLVADELRFATQLAEQRHDELRRERARLEAASERKHVELQALLTDAEAKAAGRYEALRSDVIEGFSRSERHHRDSTVPRAARYLRGVRLMMGSLSSAHAVRNLMLGARLLASGGTRRTWKLNFDADRYLEHRPDVRDANLPPDLHYLVSGYRDGQEPSTRFSAREYLHNYPDVAAAGLNPLAHYAVLGRRESRLCFPMGSPSERVPAGAASEWVPPLSQGSPDGPADGSSASGPSGSEPSPAWTADAYVNPDWPDRYPLVTVVIPSFNYGATLPMAVESVLAQTWQDLEIIVVESASSDPASAAAIREFEATRPPRTSFLYRDRPHLVGDNRNHGIEHARGRYVACLDADDTIESVYLEVAVFLAEMYRYDLVYPSVRCHGRTDHVWPAQDATFERQLERNAVSVVALFRRSPWLEAGGFRDWGAGETLVPEDWAFWTRLLGIGCRAKAIPQPLLRHHVHEGSMADLSTSLSQRQRDAIRAANEDLIRPGAGSRSRDDVRVVGGDRNLLARKPAATSGGSVLIAIPDLSGEHARFARTVGERMAREGIRVIVVATDVDPGMVADGPMDTWPTANVYVLPWLFDRRDHGEEFLHFLLRRYHVRALVLAGSESASNAVATIRDREPDVGIVDVRLEDGSADDRPPHSPVDVAVVPTEAHRRRLLDGPSLPSALRVIPLGDDSATAYRDLREVLMLASEIAAGRLEPRAESGSQPGGS